MEKVQFTKPQLIGGETLTDNNADTDLELVERAFVQVAVIRLETNAASHASTKPAQSAEGRLREQRDPFLTPI